MRMDRVRSRTIAEFGGKEADDSPTLSASARENPNLSATTVAQAVMTGALLTTQYRPRSDSSSNTSLNVKSTCDSRL